MEVKKLVTIISSIKVRPTDETPKGSLWLSRLDMMAGQPYSHSLALYVYEPNKTQNTEPPFFDTDILKKSLGKALVPFYTMAGRLQVNESNGRYEIDCNAEGVIFNEAETLCSLTDLGGRVDPDSELIKELFCKCDNSKGWSSIPLVMVQLTRFKCGGVCLGVSEHHHVADGQSYALFINSWARLAKGLDIDHVKPDHDRFKYLAPRDPPLFDDSPHSNYIEPSLPPSELYGTKASITNANFVLSESQINVLKQEAMSSSSSSYKITTYSVLAGHVWRSICKARNLSDDQEVKLYIPVDGRPVLKNPTLPPGYVGNVIVYTSCKAKAGDIINQPLWYAVNKIGEAITKLKDPEYYRSAIDYIETRPSVEPLVRGEHNFTCPNLRINSWTRIPYNEADFGWGAPILLGPGRVRSDGQSGFHPSGNHGDMTIISTFFSVHMTSFEKYLYEFK
ncbi:hypothetical protein RND81_07G190700 [Saponaria officinalis]|uniref:Shikimate O-hydroxycinnamoyltransferase n=1 Tax=Saponaria officinalis TaxID=3572 RepID=A0AAW1JTI2_SAPOF